MKKALGWLKKVAANPQARPVEIWAFRIAAGYVAVKLGIAADHSVK